MILLTIVLLHSKMKSFLVLLAVASVAFADHVDWSKVRMREPRIPLPFDLDQVLFEDRIVGGVEAVPNSIPYQVGMLLNSAQGTFFCGGSLISTTHVLTAAHCVEGITQAEVRLGAHRIQEAGGFVSVFTNRFIIHPGWDSSLLRNDVAIVVLPSPVTLGPNIQLISLPRRVDVGNSFAGQSARISGWGLDRDGAGAISPILRQVNADVMTNLACNIRFLGVIQATHLCTSGDGGRGACSGDSGGPVVIGNMQVALVSFGLGLGCELGWPSAHTRLTSFLDWIEANSDAVIG